MQIITPVASTAMSAGKRIELVCQTKGSKPPAQIKWRKGNAQLDVFGKTTSDDGFVTTGFLSMVPSLDDDRKTIFCSASNPHISDFALQDHFVMNVSRK